MALTPEDFENVERDIDDTGKAINTKGIITPRYGDPFKSVPMVVEEIENKGGFISASSLSALQAITPTYNHQVGRDDSTGNEYRWDPAATPPQWVATGRNSFKIATSSPAGNVHLNTLTTEAIYFQTVSANATTANGYPTHALNTQSRILVSKQGAVLIQSVEAKGVIATRTSFDSGANWTAFVAGLGQTDLVSLNSSMLAYFNKCSKNAEWFLASASGVISYNSTTKVLSWNQVLVGPTNAHTSNRINIAAGSVTFSGAPYEVLYIDLNNVPTNGTILSTDFAACLKIASYTTPAPNTFNGNPNQLALAKITPQGTIESCAGFVKIISKAPDIDGFQYTKLANALTVYLPAKNGNLIKHYIPHEIIAFDTSNARSQLDLWRIERALEVDNSFNELQEIVTYGEWEFAMRESAYPDDHVGGTHGDEKLTSALFLVDGIYKAQDFTVAGTKTAKEIRLQIHSTIYRYNTQTAIAYHYKELVITKDGIYANQYVTPIIQLQPDRVWIAMLPVNRVAAVNGVQVTTREIREGILNDVSSSGFPLVYTPLKNRSSVNVSGDKYTTSVEIDNLSGLFPGADIHISNSNSYNKIYVSAIGGASTGVTWNAGETIRWTTKYMVNAI
ncbi:pyocin knob domain-containing protein [Acinetobacter pittii]|uniref:pyocin knob domain-containing protein n=1 Tax=Acinetobacter pittii TaxID=48296 RepID=UPI0029530FA3|nr:pyocin knob domain-containing protein [Acinetobacter pittii]MDV8151905.1 pyocin knob domain-containing protein [Acinetobacter pittii]